MVHKLPAAAAAAAAILIVIMAAVAVTVDARPPDQKMPVTADAVQDGARNPGGGGDRSPLDQSTAERSERPQSSFSDTADARPPDQRMPVTADAVQDGVGNPDRGSYFNLLETMFTPLHWFAWAAWAVVTLVYTQLSGIF